MYDDFDEYEENDLLSRFTLPEGLEVKRVVLEIMDSSGNIEDILFELEDIYKYVKKLYEKSPKGN